MTTYNYKTIYQVQVLKAPGKALGKKYKKNLLQLCIYKNLATFFYYARLAIFLPYTIPTIRTNEMTTE